MTSFPDDQPTVTFGYNTDQFTDPITGATIHDDGSPTYTDVAGNTWFKERFVNGWCAFNVSNRIVLSQSGTPTNSYVAEDGVTPYVAEDGTTVYIVE